MTINKKESKYSNTSKLVKHNPKPSGSNQGGGGNTNNPIKPQETQRGIVKK